MEHAGTEQYPLAKSSIRHDDSVENIHWQLHSIQVADSRPDNGTGSRLYELNVWLWNYWRSLPWPISVEETDKILQKRMSESRLKGTETKRRRREGRVEPSWINVSWSNIWYVMSYMMSYHTCYDVIGHGMWRHRHVSGNDLPICTIFWTMTSYMTNRFMTYDITYNGLWCHRSLVCNKGIWHHR